ncbi:MAG: hypothetical protein ACJ8C4_13280 [Gemmataceae bacterium]
MLDLKTTFDPDRNARLPVSLGITSDDLPDDWRHHYEERAAIMEYDGGLAKEHAEAVAVADTLEAMRREGIELKGRQRRF